MLDFTQGTNMTAVVPHLYLVCTRYAGVIGSMFVIYLIYWLARFRYAEIVSLVAALSDFDQRNEWRKKNIQRIRWSNEAQSNSKHRYAFNDKCGQ